MNMDADLMSRCIPYTMDTAADTPSLPAVIAGGAGSGPASLPCRKVRIQTVIGILLTRQ